MRSTFYLLFLVVSLSVSAAVPTVSDIQVTRGTLTFASDAVIFRNKHEDEHYRYADPPAKIYEGLSIPGISSVGFQHRTIRGRRGTQSTPASILTLQNEDGTSLKLTMDIPVDVIRIDLKYVGGGKTTLWKLASEIK